VLRAWLMRTEGLSLDEATERVADLWPHLNQWNDSFRTALETFEASRASTPRSNLN